MGFRSSVNVGETGIDAQTGTSVLEVRSWKLEHLNG